MTKKKAIICTILFIIVVCGINTALIFVKPYKSEINLFDVFCPFIVGHWLGEQAGKFYEWLRKNN